MDSLHIDTGVVRIAIDDDPARVITFNPTDVDWARRFEDFQGYFMRNLEDLKEKAKPLDKEMKPFISQMSALQLDVELLEDQILELQGVENGDPLEIEKQIYELRQKIEELEAQTKEPRASIQAMTEKGNQWREDGCRALRADIDKMFGAGTSQMAFGDLLSEYAIASFIHGITPFAIVGRKEKMEKYTRSAERGKVLR